MNSLDQLDEFWRETLQSNAFDQTKYTNLLQRLQAPIAHLSQAEQDRFFMPFVARNAEYIAIAKRDKDALRLRLGLPVSSPSPVNTDRLAQVAAETVVRATIWQSIAAIFRAVR
jgi:hypothetical protein